MELLALAIGLGMVVSLLLSELADLSPAGLIVPGYVALALHRPLSLGLTLAVASVCHLLLLGLERYVILYGRRRTALAIVLGYALAAAVRDFWPTLGAVDSDTALVGFVIPGLLALSFGREGMGRTLCAVTLSAVGVRLLLVVGLGGPLGQLGG